MNTTVGIDLGGTNIKIGLVTNGGRIIQRITIPTNAQYGPEAVVANIINCLKQWQNQYQTIGIGVAGLIDHKKGIVHFSPNLPNWKNIPLKTWLRKVIKQPVYVGNDANAFVLGEYCFGKAKGAKSVFGITLGTGVGGGMIIDGKLWLGISDAAGEVGHTTINFFGPRCACGNQGCLETYVGAKYIINRTKRKKTTGLLTDKNLTPALINLASKQGDKLAQAIIRETGVYLGIGLANVISLFDPALIVIGGGLSGFGKLLLNSVKQTVQARIMNFPGRRVKIVLSKLGDDAAILGASQFPKFL